MTGVDWKDVGLRAAKTAVQTALAVLTAEAVFGGGFSVSLLQQAAIAALAAAYAVVHNALLQWSSTS